VSLQEPTTAKRNDEPRNYLVVPEVEEGSVYINFFSADCTALTTPLFASNEMMSSDD
jgi:hypothetical protein